MKRDNLWHLIEVFNVGTVIPSVSLCGISSNDMPELTGSNAIGLVTCKQCKAILNGNFEVGATYTFQKEQYLKWLEWTNEKKLHCAVAPNMTEPRTWECRSYVI